MMEKYLIQIVQHLKDISKSLRMIAVDNKGHESNSEKKKKSYKDFYFSRDDEDNK